MYIEEVTILLIEECYVGMPITFISQINLPRIYYNGIVNRIISDSEVEITYGDGEIVISDIVLLSIHKKELI